MRMRRLLIGMAAALLGTGLAWAEPLPFDVTTATEQSVAHEEVVDAVIEAVQQATVSSQTSGRVLAVNFDVDDYVTKGSVLIRFRDTEQQAALKAAQARYAEAEAALRDEHPELRPEIAGGGRLRVDSEPGEGTRVVLELDAAKPKGGKA